AVSAEESSGSSNQRPDLASLRIDRSKKFDDRPKSRRWLWFLLPVVVIIVVIVYFQLQQSVAPATVIRTTIVRQLGGGDASADLVATGYVVAQRKAEVSSKGTGRLERLNFEEGDRVGKGEIIAQLEDSDIRANLDLTKAQLEQAMVDTLNAGRQYRRARNLFESGAITDVEVEEAETAYLASLAAVSAADAAVRVAEVELENMKIRAPFDGTVLTKNADVGEMVAPFVSSSTSKGSVVTLADMNSLEVEADVSESNIYRVTVGQPCEIILDAYPGVRYAGSVKKIVPTADRARATVLTKVAFDDIDARVLPEMSARVNFLSSADEEQSGQASALVVDKGAITTRDGQRTVFRVDGEYVTAVAIEVGRELGDVREVLSGLRAGDRVVQQPPGKMTTGQKVELPN
ncbi:efflux RND transporter periplasmic adaptor subunit, partial [candidate division GN15 bacterium]|nr:efflux RND transporter periplasmic adaptor subunit [candidate division GN15 bacterium]